MNLVRGNKQKIFYQIATADEYALILLNQEIVRDQYIILGYNYD